MDTLNKLEYFKSLKEVGDGTNVNWFIFNLRKQGASDSDIVRELQIRNNMAIAGSNYTVLLNSGVNYDIIK